VLGGLVDPPHGGGDAMRQRPGSALRPQARRMLPRVAVHYISMMRSGRVDGLPQIERPMEVVAFNGFVGDDG
jgi:hypothetical protein